MDSTANRDDLRRLARALCAEVDRVVLDKADVTSMVLAALIAGGHVLLEDIPGVGKTTLALSFGRLLGLDSIRLQFTPDLTPSDITGFTMYRPDTHEFEYRPGAAFCNLLLADEVNRTSPKTQSALLEVMEERSVTVDGTTRHVPEPFFVIATQNPFGSTGTQPLPHSQLDRFMASCSLGYPSLEAELALLGGDDGSRRVDALEAMAGPSQLLEMQRSAAQTYAHDAVLTYAVRLVEATRFDDRFEVGASPRGTISLMRLAKAAAWLRGSDYVAPSDVASCFTAAVRHRVVLSPAAMAEGMSVDAVLPEIVAGVARPRFDRPSPGLFGR